MDFSKLIEELKKIELFELYRLNVAINFLLDNPEKLQLIKQRLRLGDNISYFARTSNSLVQATIIDIKQKTVKVRNKCNNEIWIIPFYMINVNKSEISIHSQSNIVLSRADLQVGDDVGFIDRKNTERYGIVTKLNPKTAVIMVAGKYKWTVAYSLLFKVMLGDAVEKDVHVAN